MKAGGATLPPKLKAYEAQDAEKAKAQKKADLDEKRAEGGLMNQAEVLLSDAIEKAKEKSEEKADDKK